MGLNTKDRQTVFEVSEVRNVEQPHPRRAAVRCGTLVRVMAFALLGLGLTGCTSQAPAAPQVVPHSITVSWDAGISPVSGYVVYRSADPIGPFTPLGFTLAGITQYTDATVVSGQTYFYLVTSFDSANEQSLPSDVGWATVPRS